MKVTIKLKGSHTEVASALMAIASSQDQLQGQEITGQLIGRNSDGRDGIFIPVPEGATPLKVEDTSGNILLKVEDTQLKEEVAPEEAKKKTKKTKVAEVVKEEAEAEEDSKESEAEAPEIPEKIDLEMLRMAYAPRYTNAEKKPKVLELIASYGFEKIGAFYEGTDKATHRDFYAKLLKI